MAWKLGVHCAVSRSLTTAKVLRLYRKEREKIAIEEVENFETVLLQRVSDRLGHPAAEIQAIVHDWIERRPLDVLRSCRFKGVADFIGFVNKSGRKVGILSDYPAQDKMAALELPYDIVVSADDAEVRLLKPNPRGLKRVIDIASVLPEETIFIGDRPERDGDAGLRAGVQTFIISRRHISGYNCFPNYTELLRHAS